MSRCPTRRSVAWIGLFGLMAGGVCLWAAGCSSDHLPVAPVEGKVLYQGKPLEFGSVIFQPKAGPPGRGPIQPDGTFRLSTYGNNDGAILGPNQVRIVCTETQRPGFQPDPNEEMPVGKHLIPEKYSTSQSSLQVDVKQKNEPFVFELTE